MDLGKDPRSVSEQFLQAVFAAAGQDGVDAVSSAVGGTAISMPMFAKPNSLLSNLLGLTAAEKVCAAMRVSDAEGRYIGRLRVLVPLGANSTKAKVIKSTKELLLQGEPVRVIAIRLGISERTVFKRRAALVAAGKLKRSGP